jgi:hypothetical protein
MQNDLFVIRLEKELVNFRLKPSASVWQQVESRIQKERKRRMILWWFFPAVILMSAGAVFMMQKNLVKPNITISNSQESIESIKGNSKTVGTTDTPHPETLTERPIEENKDHKKYTRVNINAINSLPIINPESIGNTFRTFALQTRITNNEYRPSANPTDFVTTNLEKRVNDTIIVVNCNVNANANNNNILSTKNEGKTKERQLNFNAFYSFHGSGDLSGTNLEFGAEKRFGSRYGFYNNLGVSIHAGQESGFNVNNNPLRVNSTYNALQTLTVGLQTSPTVYRYSKRGDLKIGAGLVARYQMSSYGNYAASSLGQGINQYSYTIYENDPNTLSIGYRISADLLLLEKKKNKLSFQLFFQNDTRGDVITGMGLSFQTIYKK